MATEEEYVVSCWHCLAPFDAFEASFCNHADPTKICPFCLHCSCDAPEDYKKEFVEKSPRKLLEEKMHLEDGKDLKLGEILLKNNRITEEQLQEAIEEQRNSNMRLGEIFVSKGFTTEADLRLLLVDQKEFDEFNLDDFELDLPLMKRVGIAFCLKHKLIPIELVQNEQEKIFRFVMPEKTVLNKLKAMKNLKQFLLIPYVADIEKIEALLREFTNGEILLLK